MLAGQDFRGRHQSRLPARLDRTEHRRHSDECLAGTDIALQQTHHADWLCHITGNFGYRPRLCRSRCMTKGFQHGPDQPSVASIRAALTAAHPGSHDLQRQLM